MAKTQATWGPDRLSELKFESPRYNAEISAGIIDCRLKPNAYQLFC